MSRILSEHSAVKLLGIKPQPSLLRKVRPCPPGLPSLPYPTTEKTTPLCQASAHKFVPSAATLLESRKDQIQNVKPRRIGPSRLHGTVGPALSHQPALLPQVQILTCGLRNPQLIAAAVVLGLSVTLAKHQVVEGPPAETSFASFTGGFGVFAAAVGIAAIFLEAIPSLVPLALDGLSALFFLAGGIVSLALSIDIPVIFRHRYSSRWPPRLLGHRDD